MVYNYIGEEGSYSINYEVIGEGEYLFYVNGKEKKVKILQVFNDSLLLSLEGKVYLVQILENTLTHFKVKISNNIVNLKKGDYEKFAFKVVKEERFLVSKITGKVVKVLVKEGDRVKIGDPLIILEAMKMHTIIKADREGLIKRVRVKEGDKISSGEPLVEFS